MSKAILILDMPHNMCRRCSLLECMTLNHIVKYWCGAKKLTIENANEIQDFCPLKPLPSKKEVKGDFYKQRKIATNQNTLIDFDKGYNKAIDEILGEEE